MAKKRAEPVDVQVGANIRVFRLAKGLSQSAVADTLGVTFQQVQKYENGVNRVAPSRLAKLAKLLDVPMTRFFEDKDVGRDAGTSKVVTELLSEPYSIRLLQAFNQLRSHRIRLGIVHLVEELGEQKK